ncbi:YibE/F family protein [Nonomuraea sp. MCN248]|uniref:YibE/F family protein n=1 Tax=Nonomuraea corallina TaxID=2989783 RepID=A0ABT4SHI0_9ACTN|nr:YibE/F family protein [Nonomuraea corallina]MDA0636386.1 YibE/F family protein [Nonomuraea corallina]
MPASRRAVVATLAVLLPLAVATLAALVWLWPEGRLEPAQQQAGFQRLGGTITAIALEPCGETEPGAPKPHPATCGQATVTVAEGRDEGGQVTVPLPSGPGSQRFAAGDDVVLLHNPQAEEGMPAYQLSDHDRSAPLLLLGAAFALAVIAFGRWRGVTALVGLAITFVLLLTFVIPGILAGEPPMLVAIVGASAIMLSVLFLTHGFTLATSMAVLGTLASLAVTGALSYAVIGIAKLSGITDDSSFTLDMSLSIDTQGLLLASIMIGALGVLDDVTVTQSVTVSELAAANPSYGFRRLYRAGSRIGRAHIASVINTIILAYAGASLPLLLLFSIGEQPLGEVLTTPVIAQEVARSVVGTLGLISAVPITTALAALVTSRHAPPAAAVPAPAPAPAPGEPTPRTSGDSFFADTRTTPSPRSSPASPYSDRRSSQDGPYADRPVPRRARHRRDAGTPP